MEENDTVIASIFLPGSRIISPPTEQSIFFSSYSEQIIEGSQRDD